jgi:hypothetical protein
MEPYASYASFDEGIALIPLGWKRGLHDSGFGLDKPIEDPIREVIA